jgi:hypothetical protein
MEKRSSMAKKMTLFKGTRNYLVRVEQDKDWCVVREEIISSSETFNSTKYRWPKLTLDADIPF